MLSDDTGSTNKNKKETKIKEMYAIEQEIIGDRKELVAELLVHHRNTHMAAQFLSFSTWHGRERALREG